MAGYLVYPVLGEFPPLLVGRVNFASCQMATCPHLRPDIVVLFSRVAKFFVVVYIFVFK